MKKKPILIILSLVIIFFLGGIIYGYSFLGKINKKSIPKSNQDLGITNTNDNQNNEKVINIALFGLDRRNPDQASRSDSIMVLSLDTKNQSVKVTSIMRDLYVPIPGHQDNRINAAYAFGGPVLAIKTLNSDFGLDIRDYVTVDFFGLEKVIDRVGGVTINVSSSEAKLLNEGIDEVNRLTGDAVSHVNAGTIVLNGRQAVSYSRIRYTGNGDYERTERQRRVLNEVFKKVKSQGITQLPGTISAILPYVETSLSNSDIINLAIKGMKIKTDSLEQYRIPVDGYYKGQSIRGMSVLVPDLQKNKQLLHEFIYK